jgi:UDP-glucuronate 4-epimerase
MKVVLTGIAGFIGSHLAARLLARGDEVWGFDDFDETLYPAALHQRNLDTLGGFGGLRFARGNLLEAGALDGVIGAAQADVVVHLAGLAGVRPSIAQPRRYLAVNLEGTLNLLESCRVHGVSRLVFASSSSVYGSRSQVPFREEDPADRPASPYAATKRAGELLCANYAELYGLRCCALRFFTVYGPRQRPEMAVHKFAELIRAGRPLPFYGEGSAARDYTYVDDIVDGVIAAMDRTATLLAYDPFRVYNLGGSRTTSLSRLVELLEENLGRRAQLDRQPLQPGDVPITYADVGRARLELGYEPQVPIEEGLRRFCAWLSAA